MCQGVPIVPSAFAPTREYRGLRDRLRRLLNRVDPNPFLQFVPPGHFYSPIPDPEVVDRYRCRLFDRQVRVVPGIDNHTDAQLALLKELAAFYDELPFEDRRSTHRYNFANPFFGYGDAIVLYTMLRHYRPARVIEVGSGFSSAVMLDTNDLFLEGAIKLTFIEPFPERLFSLMRNEDHVRSEVVSAPVQDIPVQSFASLRANDILFIDSSHVVKVGSDVDYLLTWVLPALERGVIVHFHDVFWPFEYPEAWIREGRAWTEAYALRAFLQFNSAYRILLFNSYLATHHKEELSRHLPLAMKNTGGSLWMTKTS
jgi:predicted O-methyltransferase YrrM